MPDPSEMFAYLDATTHAITLPGLRNSLLPGYVTTATVTIALTDAATGAQIAGQTWPAALDYVAGSNGDYRGTLESDLVVTVGQRLLGRVVAVSGGGVQRTWVIDILVVQG